MHICNHIIIGDPVIMLAVIFAAGRYVIWRCRNLPLLYGRHPRQCVMLSSRCVWYTCVRYQHVSSFLRLCQYLCIAAYQWFVSHRRQRCHVGHGECCLLCLRPHRAEALSDAFVWCLTSVWRLSVTYIRPNSITERPRKTKIRTEVAHFTRDSYTTFKVKGQLIDVLNSWHAGTGATWRINAKILSTCRGLRHIVSPRA